MSRPAIVRLSLCLLVCAPIGAGLAACQGQLTGVLPDPSAGTPPAAEPAAAKAPPAVLEQIRRGTGLYAQLCASCHGARGEGTANAPPVIGAAALPANPLPGSRMRRGAFRSAKDVGMFIMTTMPPGGPRVPPPNVAAVLAYLLDQNGATPSQAVSPTTAGSMPIHR